MKLQMTDVQRVRFVKAIAENALKNMECEIMQDDLKLVIEHLKFLLKKNGVENE